MPVVTFTPSGESVEVETGTDLLTAARRAGVRLDSPCGGEGSCGDCAVRLISGDVETQGPGVLSQTEADDGFVLACSSWVESTPVTLEVPEQKGTVAGAPVEPLAYTDLVQDELLPAAGDLDPICVRAHLTVPEPRPGEGRSDLDRLLTALGARSGGAEVETPLPVLRRVAEVLRAESGEVTVTFARSPGRCRLIDIEVGHGPLEQHGVAVDLGTTIVGLRLVRLPTGETVASLSDYNAQIDCGLDVISRINYARGEGRLEELRERVLGTINGLIRRIASRSEVRAEEIREVRVSGNPTMAHLLLGLNPEYIRIEPYTPTLHELEPMTAAEVGIVVHPLAPVTISPSVGSYVGGDISAGLLCTDLTNSREPVSLFMDIGTNGELVVGNREFLMACACSAGPAFEGGGIRQGMRAAYGAIDRVEVDPETGRAQYGTIGDGPPRGICGSGMVSLLASLFLSGWIDGAGKLDRARSSESVRIEGRRGSYRIVAAADARNGEAIWISETEIANIVRAKAAVYSACSLMLVQLGVDFAELETVYVAGGFGRFLDIESATVIGLLPDLPREKFRYLGNSSLMGTHMGLVSRKHRERQLNTARRMTYLELNTDPGYMDQYTAALFLPHTDAARFPSVRRRGS